jgi:hypothetical protein
MKHGGNWVNNPVQAGCLIKYVKHEIKTLSPLVTLYYTRLNIQKFYVLATDCVCVFLKVLRTKTDYFPTA